MYIKSYIVSKEIEDFEENLANEEENSDEN